MTASLRVVRADPVVFAERFYTRLFTAAPRLRTLFPTHLAPQRERLAAALLAAVEAASSRDPAEFEPTLRRLGARHAARYQVRAEHYPLVGAALVQAARDTAAGHWSTRTSSAWVALYEWLAGHMLRGAQAAGDTTPLPAELHRAVEQATPTPPVIPPVTQPVRPGPGRHSASAMHDLTAPLPLPVWPSPSTPHGQDYDRDYDTPPLVAAPGAPAQRRAPQHAGTGGRW